ncbi:MAG: ATP-dependent DNA helicase RecG [Acidimicrobiaceae bacterium]|nr:ATP-dependent DNA helicase RecG [Acidimicrobiaceae bacterium]MXW76434.1 ATP-dependent DNA helicase RecG [Acidimicrobiaceae bacterium]MYC41458.1 ATP-dependent DNA helicase RecG [Acidimicrobiaceae bacterium]MYD07083.1 ATP-dependent DNA helicase RecG [Acidimicrobiaceae bacterium]MYI59086.1 ATP-dependent DNA helicase RecG [Acidimicrobiaceae bacterium]
MPAGDPPLTLRDLAGIKVTQLRGVGQRIAEQLLAVEISTVLDLIQHYPRRYLDRTRQAQIAELLVGDEAWVLGTVRSAKTRKLRGRRTLTNVVIGDGTGKLTLTFFNQHWRERQLKEGLELFVHGKLTLFRGERQMTSPVVDLIGDQPGKIVPVYPQSEKVGLTTSDLAGFIRSALERSRVRGFDDPVPGEVLDRFDFVDREAALYGIHLPESMAEMQEARRRLVFDELFRVQLELVRRKARIERRMSGVAHDMSGELVDRFHARLPFALTDAQRRVNAEIAHDLAVEYPMHRLLQGDVGSGKTVVAVTALLTAVEGGYQGAFMAPTEVLAEQHYLSVSDMLGDLSVPDPTSLLGDRPLRVELLTNSVGAAARRQVLDDLIVGQVDIVIGTHALIQEKVQYQSLGMVVIDEQHRFGVEQRAALRDKGESVGVPDVLVMTATPIPRTAAMTVYGDLDVSVLDEMPPGRSPIITSWAEGPIAESEVWETVRNEVAQGRQAYVVCPLIEESAVIEVHSVEDTYLELQSGELSGLRVGLLHGRVSPAEKEATMAHFRAGTIDVLVATTVIEVGVDVPNATVMVVFDADRFGIAQLHQLRGRVGRGEHQGLCYLLGDPSTNDGEARIEALVASTDGFELAEVDLELRGEGTIMGERQKGRNDLRLASLRRDKEWVSLAREVATGIIAQDPELTDHPELGVEVDLMLGDNEAEFLMKS